MPSPQSGRAASPANGCRQALTTDEIRVAGETGLALGGEAARLTQGPAGTDGLPLATAATGRTRTAGVGCRVGALHLHESARPTAAAGVRVADQQSAAGRGGRDHHRHPGHWDRHTCHLVTACPTATGAARPTTPVVATGAVRGARRHTRRRGRCRGRRGRCRWHGRGRGLALALLLVLLVLLFLAAVSENASQGVSAPLSRSAASARLMSRGGGRDGSRRHGAGWRSGQRPWLAPLHGGPSLRSSPAWQGLTRLAMRKIPPASDPPSVADAQSSPSAVRSAPPDPAHHRGDGRAPLW